MSKPRTELIAAYFEALNHPTRIEILELLKDRNLMCVCEIVAKLKKDQSNISRHLNALKRQAILECQSEGVRSFYRVKNKDVYKILELVKNDLRDEIEARQKVFSAI
jgi:ArsR family transcriptional regulator